MSRIVPTFDSRGFEAQADRVHADLIRAAVRAVNATALRVLDGLRVSMEEHLDAPKPKTLDGLVFEKARVGKTPTATISVKPEVVDYLQYAVVGGTRTDMIIPSSDAPLDSHGNLRRGYLRAVEARGGFWMVASSGVPTLFEPDGMGGITEPALRSLMSTAAERQTSVEAIARDWGKEVEGAFEARVYDGGVAVIPVFGPLMRHLDFWSGCSARPPTN